MPHLRLFFYLGEIMTTKSWIQLGMGITGFIVWTADVYFLLNLPETYMAFVQSIVVGVVGHALGGISAPERIDVPKSMSTAIINEEQK